jgi:hypothetical protein
MGFYLCYLCDENLLSMVDGCESGNEDNNVRDSDNAVKFCEESFDNSAFSCCNR